MNLRIFLFIYLNNFITAFSPFLIFNKIQQQPKFTVIEHPLEKRIVYINGLNNIENIDNSTLIELKKIFEKHPLIIIKNNIMSPKSFINFIKHFDDNCDIDALNNPNMYPNQMLQPFDQIPNCEHVAPRGNIKLQESLLNDSHIKPHEPFISNYLWHTDMLGHEYKLTNVITAFYIIKQPLIGGDTDFISGETIYENLNKSERLASYNLLVEINRNKMLNNMATINYPCTVRTEKYVKQTENVKIPILFPPEGNNEQPRILLLPAFFEKIVGVNVDESRKWINNFMINKVLPHRVTVQWKENDIAIINNRRFMHSSTPARNYLDNEISNERLLLQIFLPTKRPLLAYRPILNGFGMNLLFKQNGFINQNLLRSISKYNLIYKLKWISDLETSIKSFEETLYFIKNKTHIFNNKYIYRELL
jgi:alpha-ketoglutarate-dependent taurine dioxygenase